MSGRIKSEQVIGIARIRNSQAGAKASANLYSLIQTAKANGLNPYDYLKQVFTQLPNATRIEDIEALLPWAINTV